MTFKRALLLALVLLTGAQAYTAVIPLPVLPSGTLTLRVAHVVNPRLPRITDAQLSALLAATARTAHAHWGVTLRFAPAVEMDIATLFERIPVARRKLAAKQSFDFKSGHGDPDKLARAYGSGFKASQEPLDPMVAYARAHGANVDGKNYPGQKPAHHQPDGGQHPFGLGPALQRHAQVHLRHLGVLGGQRLGARALAGLERATSMWCWRWA
jgi:hypothetical protein